MKKLVLILTCLCMIFSFSISSAEETAELNWSEIGTEEIQALGSFQQIEIADQPTIIYWIPSIMYSVDVSAIEGGFKPTALYTTEDQAYSVTIFSFEVSSLEEYATMIESEGGGSDFNNLTVNGVDCISYEVKDSNMECLIYPITENLILTFSLVPMDGDDDWDATKAAIVASIQPVL